MGTLFLFTLMLAYCCCVLGISVARAESTPHLSVAWNVVGNDIGEGGGGFYSELVLSNQGAQDFDGGPWKLYFNYCRRVLPESIIGNVTIDHVNGDLFVLSPGPEFSPLPAGESRVIRFQTDFWAIKESDAPSGFYLEIEDPASSGPTVVNLGEATVGLIAEETQINRRRDDRIPIPTVRSRYLENLATEGSTSSESRRVIPTPVDLAELPGVCRVDSESVIQSEPAVSREAALLADFLQPVLGNKLRIQDDVVEGSEAGIRLTIGAVTVAGEERVAGDNAYQLRAEGNTVTITGTDPAGVFHGIQTLRVLIPASSYREASDAVEFPSVEIADSPRFGYRGVHLDVARNFQPVRVVKKLLDVMALYKLNRFHFHLTDDEGWRLEIDGLPELTEVGANRGRLTSKNALLPPSFGSGPGNGDGVSYGSGYYTREEFIDLLRYASARHIEVIPEIDLPGHARAAIQSMAARRERFLAEGDTRSAHEFALDNVNDDSIYESVQMWNDNVVDVCQESTYAFVNHVVREVELLYEEAGTELKLLHTGGDEVPQGVWADSPACRPVELEQVEFSEKTLSAEFFGRIAKDLRERGVAAAAWEEVFLREGRPLVSAGLDRGLAQTSSRPVCYAWNNVWGWGQEDAAYRLANAGVDVVLCNATHLYFDLAYSKDPHEPGYYWAGFVDTRRTHSFAPTNYVRKTGHNLMGQEVLPAETEQREKLSAEGKRHLLGIQGQLWGETLKGGERLEYMALPRLIALAERAWAPEPAWEPENNTAKWSLAAAADWREFAKTLGTSEFPRLDYFCGGYAYRVPPVGAVIQDGVLEANTEFPGFTIRYTVDDSEPTLGSPIYRGPVEVGDRACVRVRAFTASGRGGRSDLIQELDSD